MRNNSSLHIPMVTNHFLYFPYPFQATSRHDIFCKLLLLDIQNIETALSVHTSSSVNKVKPISSHGYCTTRKRSILKKRGRQLFIVA